MNSFNSIFEHKYFAYDAVENPYCTYVMDTDEEAVAFVKKFNRKKSNCQAHNLYDVESYLVFNRPIDNYSVYSCGDFDMADIDWYVVDDVDMVDEEYVLKAYAVRVPPYGEVKNASEWKEQ